MSAFKKKKVLPLEVCRQSRETGKKKKKKNILLPIINLTQNSSRNVYYENKNEKGLCILREEYELIFSSQGKYFLNTFAEKTNTSQEKNRV